MVRRYTLESLIGAGLQPAYPGTTYAPPALAGAEEPDGVTTVLPPYIAPAPPPVVAPAPVIAPAVVQPGIETEEPALGVGITNGLGVLNGVAPLLGEEAIYPEAPVAIPTFAPIAAVGAVMSLGVFKALLSRFGPTILKAMLGAGVFAALMRLLGMGAPDNAVVSLKKRRKRYSIGANPRVGTLSKVSRHCMRMLKRHRKVIDEFLPPKRKALPATALARTYLSTAERKALSA